MTNIDTVLRTKSGVFVRRDEGIGLLAYSPYTGLSYAVPEGDAEKVLKWLALRGKVELPIAYERTLGVGWKTPFHRAKHTIPHLLPDLKAWHNVPSLSRPITINWFITGRCPLACRYCYAEELMRNEDSEPSADQIAEIADSILALNPLVVVLTGGDPLFSPRTQAAAERLRGKVGLVLDTSGYTFKQAHLDFFKRDNISVRISFDSEIPRVNQFQRPLYSKYTALVKSGVSTLEAAVNTLEKCLQNGITVTVQTVATKRTVNDLPAMGDKLFRLGLRSWRVLRVIPSKASIEGYRLLEQELPTRKLRVKDKAYAFVFEKLLDLHRATWRSGMALQVTANDIPNSVILVSPDGNFFTESNIKIEKLLIDPQRPKRPRVDQIHSNVNMQAHADRYLNITSQVYSKED